jgi:hypothetical protein
MHSVESTPRCASLRGVEMKNFEKTLRCASLCGVAAPRYASLRGVATPRSDVTVQLE